MSKLDSFLQTILNLMCILKNVYENLFIISQQN
jgi:hypothetical protein